jgi:hypothetical protein
MDIADNAFIESEDSTSILISHSEIEPGAYWCFADEFRQYVNYLSPKIEKLVPEIEVWLEGLHKLNQGLLVGVGKIGPEVVTAILDKIRASANFQ